MLVSLIVLLSEHFNVSNHSFTIMNCATQCLVNCQYRDSFTEKGSLEQAG